MAQVGRVNDLTEVPSTYRVRVPDEDTRATCAHVLAVNVFEVVGNTSAQPFNELLPISHVTVALLW